MRQEQSPQHNHHDDFRNGIKRILKNTTFWKLKPKIISELVIGLLCLTPT
jgi:hypothetical protein